MGAGQLRDRVTFERRTQISDGGGGFEDGWTSIAGLEAIRGAFMPQRSRERLEAGRLESGVAGALKVRYSAATSGVTAADRVQINGTYYAINAITQPDRRNRYLEMTVVRGSGQ